ncbi:hypothetical protein HYFRA_00011969 [Hymenoscyphus fraxineus]|uniref:ERCC4 domain-containing protein n=1 Tax=Hymenoscyphus fraxineus TaxID=746836 RepID=A0A9N9KYS2_9HELO|nr:hypothetical protein HYFRA_00011969 [Hymenoscyphus fraxineus]
MATITIDLISSSPAVSPIVPQRTKQPMATSRASSHKPPPAKNNGYLSLSDDDDDPFRSSPDKGTIPSTFPSSKPNVTKESPKKTKVQEYYILSDDDVESNVIAKPQPKKVIQEKDPFYFLSDDFDSTANFDNSFANNEPSTKRRRLSSSPEPSLPKAPRARDFSRSLSNTEASKRKPPQKRTATGLQRSKTAGAILESDPLIFTSSPDPFDGKRKKQSRVRLETVEDEGEFASLSSDEEFPDLLTLRSTASQSQKSSKAALRKFKEAREAEKTGKPISKPIAKPKTKITSSKSMTEEEKAEEKERKAREKAEAAEKKLAAKEAEKEQKRLAKEQQARDKALAAELDKVNTLKIDKKVTAPEMVIQLSCSIDAHINAQIRKLAEQSGIDVEEYQDTQPLVKWKRKVESRYNDDAGQWETVPKHMKQENHIICLMKAKEFVALSLGEEGSDLDAHALKIRTNYPDHQIIYMIEGIAAWMRNNKKVQANQFADAVRSHAPNAEEPTTNGRARKRKTAEYVDEDMIEDALLRLQVVHGMLIHHTDAKIQTAEWVEIFTQYISIIPRKRQQESHNAAFCMESGQIKSGDDTPDTFDKILQQIIRITPGISQAIVAEHKTVQGLVQAFENDGPGAVKDLCKAINKNGGVSDKKVGQAASKRIFNVFMGRDEKSFDV